MSTLWWDPFRDIVTLRQTADSLLENNYLQPRTRAASRRQAQDASTLPVDVYEANDELVVRASVPGAGQEDVDVRVDNDVLTISARIYSEAEKQEAREYTWYRYEIGHGSLSRSLSLPQTYDAGAAVAKLENGILTLRIPKSEAAKPKQIKVTADPALSASPAK